MKHICILTIAAALAFAACTDKVVTEPEPAPKPKPEPEIPVPPRYGRLLVMNYTVGSEQGTATLDGDSAYRAKVGELLEAAREGSQVSMVLIGVEYYKIATKGMDTVMASGSPEAVTAWVERMCLLGYEVCADYSTPDGWHCVAHTVATPAPRHLWQCDTNGFTIRLAFWNDSLAYAEVHNETSWILGPFSDGMFYSWKSIDTSGYTPPFEKSPFLLMSFDDPTYASYFLVDTVSDGVYRLDYFIMGWLDIAGDPFPCDSCMPSFVFVEL